MVKIKEIGSLARIIVLEDEAPTINKDLLLTSCSEGGNKILVFVTIDLELEEGSMEIRKEKCLNFKFAGGFSGAIEDGMQED
jgi:hypothetical protein